MRDHPTIEQIERTGYPNIVAQPEHNGTDYFGDEILVGDDIAEDGGELILQDNLEKYLADVYGFKFKTAE
ncbi:YqaI family protein [Mesobacillus zeae]|uniref:YqaI-like protein n=1 Tax=Mesobacillus zeae TaxID=1917180 RepID=A0A398B823_9BACI|nr:hypothetical protein [Mesobacillus zeae]RID85634.1 hypothetical protein D1970_08750 [Mesobacillus zeae]